MGLAAALLLLAAAAADAPQLHPVHVVHSPEFQKVVDYLARKLDEFPNVKFTSEWDPPSGIGRVMATVCDIALAGIATLPPGWVGVGNGWRVALLRLVLMKALIELRVLMETTGRYALLVDGVVVYTPGDATLRAFEQWNLIMAKIGSDPIDP
eukprot:TRINITY_DN25999_c0_g1_i1.p1 TRINITY_DN25999_c0_g1~~TRINITY_DN25999_c0_g1_i1.p1  ORF type:complete len:153 (+),score=32.32 TRINITY_DN25999_c0_g1_i1:75-533(+)